MSKHTPGPWNEEIFGDLFDPLKHPIDEVEANLLLALAAPDLLEALQDLMDEQNGVPLIRHADDWQAAMDKAAAAIAKAEPRAEGKE